MAKQIFTQIRQRLSPEKWVTLAVCLAALLTCLAQFVYTAHPEYQFGLMADEYYDKLSLHYLSERAADLGHITNRAERDDCCIPLSGFSRRLDQNLPKDARIFIGGALGTNRGPRLAVYFFLRNYLFPRDMEISLGRPAVAMGDEFAGITPHSTAELRTNGFDIFIQLGPSNAVKVIALTNKGTPGKAP